MKKGKSQLVPRDSEDSQEVTDFEAQRIIDGLCLALMTRPESDRAKGLTLLFDAAVTFKEWKIRPNPDIGFEDWVVENNVTMPPEWLDS